MQVLRDKREQKMNNLKIGFAKLSMDPPTGIGIDGYYVPRFAKGFLDELQVMALMLESGATKILLLSVDSCGIAKDLVAKYAKKIEEKINIPKENVFISATHTHTGPLTSDTDFFEADINVISAYAEKLGNIICDAARLANDDLKPARMGYITGSAPERVAYIRRYKMKDGTTFTCPPINDPNIVGPIGTLDQRVNVVRFDRDNAPTVIIVNYGLHSDTVNGELFSADWPGWMRKTLKDTLDGAECIFLNGAEGDVGSTNVHPKDGDMNDTEISFDNEMKSPGMARFVGRAIAGTVLQVFDKAKYIDVDSISMVHKTVKIPANTPTEEELPLAHEYKRLHEEGREDEIPFKAMQLTTAVAEALRMCRLENGPEYFELDLLGVRLGEVALIGIPGEPFTDIGVQIKESDGFGMIMPCSLTNGNEGYFPSKSAYEEGGYESKTSSYKSGVSDIIISASKEILDELK